MDIEEIKQYAEKEIEAFTMFDRLEAEEYEMSHLAMAHLRMRQLILVASIAESLGLLANQLTRGSNIDVWCELVDGRLGAHERRLNALDAEAPWSEFDKLHAELSRQKARLEKLEIIANIGKIDG